MPFKCELTLGESLAEGGEIHFVGWVRRAWDSESEWGKIVDAGTPYAVVSRNGILGKIYTTFRVALIEQGNLAPGDKISSGTVLAVVAAEGDEIAYGKPYSIYKLSGRGDR